MQGEDPTVAANEPSTSEGADEKVEGLWGAFDQQVAITTSRRTTTSEAVVDMQQYLQLMNVDRKDDPLLWWKKIWQSVPTAAAVGIKVSLHSWHISAI